MAVRVNWKGYLKLSLVSCSVALVPATSTRERVRFHNLNKSTGHRLRQRMVDEDSGKEVEREDRVKGYEVEKNRYIQVTDEELEEVALESTHTIEIESFVPREEIDRRYLDQPYYLFPNDKVSEEAYVVIREAMRDEKRVALARVVLYGRERVVMIEAMENGMLATTLRYGNEVREAKPYFEDIHEHKVSKEMLELARHIIEQKAAHFDPSDFKDRYDSALKSLLRSKKAGKPIEHHERERPSKVVNLMDALKKSVANERRPQARSRTERRRPAKRATARSRARKAS